MNSLVTIGAFVQGMATLVFVANLVISYFKGKKAGNHPWDAWALEWSGRCMQEKKRIPSDVAAYLAEHYTDEPLSVRGDSAFPSRRKSQPRFGKS